MPTIRGPITLKKGEHPTEFLDAIAKEGCKVSIPFTCKSMEVEKNADFLIKHTDLGKDATITRMAKP